MALVLPIFMVIVLGIFEIGRAMMVEQALSNGARLGARRAILPNKSKTEVEQLVKTFCQDSFNANVTVAISVDGYGYDANERTTGRPLRGFRNCPL